MRSLASVQRIDELIPIENADFIELAKIEGWQAIVKKGEFQVGSLCVYIEIDSVLNSELDWVKEHASFMEKYKWRVHSLKMRGVLSQGLALPICILPGIVNYPINITIEDDVSEILGIVKYEAPIHYTAGETKGGFPTSIISKTDETRIQNCKSVLADLQGKPYYITVKMDGCSSTYLMYNDEFTVCSRNESKKDSEGSVFWKMARKYNIEEILKENPNICFQAELVGEGIQSNRLELKDHELFIFNVYDKNKMEYLDFEDAWNFCGKNKLPTVPIEGIGNYFNYTFEELLELAKGKYSGTNNDREGIVVRPQYEMWNHKLGRFSFKVLNNDFLLGQKGEDE